MTREQLQRFVASLVHEFNNPLAAILGYADLLQYESDPEQLSKGVDTIKEQALRCRQIISRVEECFVLPGLRSQDVSVSDVLSTMVICDAEVLAAKGIEVSFQIDAGLPAVNLDLPLFQKALGRLVENAVESLMESDAQRLLVLSASSSDGFINFDVSDNGRGGLPECREDAFHPAYTNKRAGNGLGLGLLSARAIIEKHGGTLEFVEDENWNVVLRASLPVGSGSRRR